MTALDFTKKHCVSLLIVALATVVSYSNVFDIPFLYSEKAGIERNAIVKNLDVFYERMLTAKGLLQKPLSMLTFALNYALHGAQVPGYHLVNLLIHLANAYLVFVIAALFFRAPLISALFFALHPLSTSVASQIFGRTYSLGTFFMLLALLLYLKAEQKGGVEKTKVVSIVLLFVLAVLSKQVFVFLPIIALWRLLCKDTFRLKLPTMALAVIGSSIGLVFALLYAKPLSDTAAMSSKEFLLSQFGNFRQLLSFYFLPFQTSLIHPLPVYRSLSNPEVGLGLLLFGAILVFVFAKRKREVGFLLGSLLICLLPTNSIFPKNEIIREWRLYPSLVFAAILLGYSFEYLRSIFGSYLSRGAALGWLLVFAISIYSQNEIYRSDIETWQQIASRYPESADAEHNLGLAYEKEGDDFEAIKRIKRAIEMDPQVSLFYKNLSKIHSRRGEREMAINWGFKSAITAQVYGSRSMSLSYR